MRASGKEHNEEDHNNSATVPVHSGGFLLNTKPHFHKIFFHCLSFGYLIFVFLLISIFKLREHITSHVHNPSTKTDVEAL